MERCCTYSTKGSRLRRYPGIKPLKVQAYKFVYVRSIENYALHPVILDIVGRMLEDKCLKEIFRAQQVFSKRALKNIFDQLAQSSIMKLNKTAMDKVRRTVKIFCVSH